MPMCKFCGAAFSWGNSDGKWMTLIPVGEEGEHNRDYQDENGALRSSHAQVCIRQGGPAVRVSKLAKAVPASDILSPSVPPPDTLTNPAVCTAPDPEKKKRGRPRKQKAA